MLRPRGFWAGFLIFVSFACMLAPSASAFEARKGKLVTIKADEVINDDVYVAGETIVLEGTVNGDLVAFARDVIVKGTVKGSLFAAARKVSILGTVTGNVRMAGAELSLGEKAQVNGDVVAAGAGLDLAKGSVVGRDLLFAGAALLLAGNVTRNVSTAAGGLLVKGQVGGNLYARVGEVDKAERAEWRQRITERSEVVLPPVDMGIVIDPDATIAGSVDYTQSKDIAFPAQAIKGKVTRTERAIHVYPELEKTHWVFGFLGSLLSLLLIGLILLLLFPRTLSSAAEKLREAPVVSFLWGLLAIVVVIPLCIIIFIATLLLAGLFALLGLWPLAGVVIALAVLFDLVMIFLICFIAMFAAKIVVGLWLGRWLLSRQSSSGTGRFLPMLIGVPIVVIAIELLSWLPVFGHVLGSVVFLCGLGALWMRNRIARNS